MQGLRTLLVQGGGKWHEGKTKRGAAPAPSGSLQSHWTRLNVKLHLYEAVLWCFDWSMYQLQDLCSPPVLCWRHAACFLPCGGTDACRNPSWDDQGPMKNNFWWDWSSCGSLGSASSLSVNPSAKTMKWQSMTAWICIKLPWKNTLLLKLRKRGLALSQFVKFRNEWLEWTL